MFVCNVGGCETHVYIRVLFMSLVSEGCRAIWMFVCSAGRSRAVGYGASASSQGLGWAASAAPQRTGPQVRNGDSIIQFLLAGGIAGVDKCMPAV